MGWRKEHNTTPKFREAPRRKSKSNYWQPKKPKGTADMGILGTNFVVFFAKTKCFFLKILFSQNFVVLVQIRPILLFFGKKFAKVFDVTKLKKTHPWESGLPTSISSVCILKLQTLMYTQTPRYQLYPWYLIPSPFFLLGNKHQHTNTAPTTNHLQFLLK